MRANEKILQSIPVSQKMNMISRNIVIFAVLFIFGYIQIGVIGLQCYNNSNDKITCDATNANSTRDNANYTSIFKSNNTLTSTQFGCIALNYTDTAGNKTLKGCTYVNVNCQNETLSDKKLTTEQCKFCTNDLCNSGPQITKSLSAIILPIVISVFGFKLIL
ncbi:hypothetical protein ACFFRR_004313 [Megaselia abdita]